MPVPDHALSSHVDILDGSATRRGLLLAPLLAGLPLGLPLGLSQAEAASIDSSGHKQSL